MSALEWLLVIELILIAIMAVMGAVASFIARQDPDDPFCAFCTTFWREFLWPPVNLPLDGVRAPAGQRPAARPPAHQAEADDEPSEDDAFYGRVRKGRDGKNLVSMLDVLVEPNAAADEVVGRDDSAGGAGGAGIRLRVTGEAGESRSNKALIEIVAGALGVKPYQVTLTKGHYQNKKAVQVQGVSPDELQSKLAALPEAE